MSWCGYITNIISSSYKSFIKIRRNKVKITMSRKKVTPMKTYQTD